MTMPNSKTELWWAVGDEAGVAFLNLPNGMDAAALFSTREDAEDVRYQRRVKTPSLTVEPVSVVRDGGAMAKKEES
jgi:hypothetical protein